MGPHELWDEPWEGLPEEEGAWEWDLTAEEENGATKSPPDSRIGWKRWYFVYHEPACTNIKISSDRDPGTGQWFNPHRSSGTIDSMKPTLSAAAREATDREALRRRVQLFYRRFNNADWKQCYALIDPLLTRESKVAFDRYAQMMQAFKDAYGTVSLWYTRLSLHLDVTPRQRDGRPFAYTYVIWQDQAHAFHMFRERWVKDHGQWFTRVVGLVPNQQGANLAD